ncbi:MAG TPA: integrin alpha, partial [Kofleriaceae bacterium]|nr:integrin alpha [Kofleriaceae bacterium]
MLSALAPAAALAGCGDGILCDSSPLVVIQAPTSAITVDGDPAAPGVQTDVRVRSTLLPADGLELVVLDAEGAEVATLRMPAGADGSTVFPGVTLPSPRATLRATGRSACGLADDEVEIEVVAGSGCDLQIQPSPQAVAGYPVGVLAAAIDPDPAPGFQAQLAVATRAGWTVELHGDTGQGEQPRGIGLADAMGLVRFPQTLADGTVSFRAVCRGAGGEVLPSVAASAIVDTTPPACDFTSPLPGSSITPAHDTDGDLGNGVQLALEARIDGGDAAGEPPLLTITSDAGSETVEMSPVDAQGTSTVAVTLDPAATPATFQLALAARDRAGNLCTRTRPYDVVYDGCSIEVVAPTGPVTADADGIPGNGSQVDIQLAVDPACIGRTVTSTCGANSPAGVVPASGPLTLRADLCGSSPCEEQATCTFRVSSPAGVETQASAVIAFDDQGPAVSVEIAEPQLPCGAQITPASDVDMVTPGVQIFARVVAADATGHTLALTNTAGTQTVPAPGDVKITIAPGLNLLTGSAQDSLGNAGTSPICTIALADIAVAVDPPAADGVLGRADGAVSGGALTFPLCGTLDHPGASVAIRIDGGPPLAATVNGTTWCRTVTLAEADHAVSVMATKGLSFGNAALPLRVDLTPPDPIAAYGGTVPSRQRVGLAWTAPADGGGPAAAYVVKWSTTPLTEANFETEGTVIPAGAPRSPGAAEAVELFPARMGTQFWLGVAAVDRAGNRTPPAIAGPITPAFDQLGPIGGPNPDQGYLAMGAAIAHGRFNDDDYDDLAIAAPGQHAGGLLLSGAVHVYLGGPGGIAPTPSLTIVGGAA